MTAKRLFVLAGIGVLALFLFGLVIGAIGSSFVDKEGFVPKPEVHLPPQPVFPASTRDDVIGLNRFVVKVHPLGDAEEAAVRSAVEKAVGAENISEFEGHREDEEIEVVLANGVAYYDVKKDVEKALAEVGAEAEKGHFEGMGFLQFAVTNTMLSSWVSSIVLVALLVFGARKGSMVPGRLQNLVEIIVEALLRFVETVVGRGMSRAIFPMIATLFLFVLFNAWMALIPIWPSLGFTDPEGNLKGHLLRSAGTDINMPLALALISFVFVEYWGFRSKGLGYLGKFFSLNNLLKLRLANIFVGFLEFVSELVRVVSFTFRLFGNMTAGEILVVMVAFLLPFVAGDLVYSLELLVGLVQALIFAGLTLVFVSVAIAHDSH